MAESDRSGLFYPVGDLFDLVAPGAFYQGKILGAVMAGTAGFPLFHLRHGVVARCQFTALMACLATEICSGPGFFPQMGLVAEHHLSRIPGCEGYILEIHGESD
jgi:hypothetical protein